MKKNLSPLILALTMLCSCSKNSSPGGGGNGGNNGNNGNNGGNNSGMTITSLSPANPYPDDNITITGTGFNSDPTKDTVEFGPLKNGVFAPWHDGLATEWASLATVVSATSTQLVIKAVNVFGLDYSNFSSSITPVAVIQVKTGGKKVLSSIVPFRRLFQLSGINNPDYSSSGASIGRPNDSLEILGKGFSKNILASIDGTPLSNFKVDSNANGGKITLRLPKSFFGEVNDDNIAQTKTVTITNAGGKSLQKDFLFQLSPAMHISDMHAENDTYSIGGLAAIGGVIKITIKGRCLKSDAIIKVGSAGYQSSSGLQVSGFPDSTAFTISPNVAGNYNVTIWRGSTLYGGCSFRLNL